MNTSHPLPPHPAAELAMRLNGILVPLVQFLFGRLDRLGAVASLLHNRVSRARVRLLNLFTRLAEGRLPRLRAARPDNKAGPRAPHLPRRRAWIVATLGYHAAAYASQLQIFLDDPQTRAILAAAPPQVLKSAARSLRPLCRLLGVDLPPLLQPPPKPPRAKTAKPRCAPTSPPLPTPGTPDRPLPRYILRAVRAWKPRSS